MAAINRHTDSFFCCVDKREGRVAVLLCKGTKDVIEVRISLNMHVMVLKI
jgi:hypothetical protein